MEVCYWEPEDRRNRSKLTVHNQTVVEEGPGATLTLSWGGDTRPEGQKVDVGVGQNDTKESKYVKNGGNWRTFDVTVSKGDIAIGNFLHSVYNAPSPADAGVDDTYIRVDYQREGVLLYRVYFTAGSPEGGAEMHLENIGMISVEDWES
ncbi:hypothetical protein [Bacillus sp. Cr_A10]|uniref:hypothetical protein n=1 Tax=Bacillus sp. Cr_A10 TaxID=3033993 RepID=UPI0023D9CA74|nr:hypothetical protein [Bacillus sp. Cr_A10]MDF2064957.1 hypothetical protein [Bacillus sp. Cr_A10]